MKTLLTVLSLILSSAIYGQDYLDQDLGMKNGKFERLRKYPHKDLAHLYVILDCDSSIVYRYEFTSIPFQLVHTNTPEELKNSSSSSYKYVIKKHSGDSVRFLDMEEVYAFARSDNANFRIDTLLVEDKSLISHKELFNGRIAHVAESLPLAYALIEPLRSGKMKGWEISHGYQKHGIEVAYFHPSELEGVCIEDNFLIKSKTLWKDGIQKKDPEIFGVNGRKR